MDRKGGNVHVGGYTPTFAASYEVTVPLMYSNTLLSN